MQWPSLENLLLDTPSPGVLRATLSRPAARNAISTGMMGDLEHLLNLLEQDPTTRVLILTGEGSGFAAGGDLKEFAAMISPGEGAAMAARMHAILDRVERLGIPVVAAVNGPALGGGCELLLACDIVIAAETASVGMTEITVGLIPGWGGHVRLAARVGFSRAAEWIMTGRRLTIVEAHAAGLISRVVPAADLPREATALATRLVAMPRASLAAIKEILRTARDRGFLEAQEAEKRLFAGVWGAPDHIEGLKAFFEKRPPEFNR
jgi:enoyl-CoA hydratase/carnithine racemase